MSISERKHVSEGEAPARRVEIFTGAGRRRSWSAREKAAIVAESFEQGEMEPRSGTAEIGFLVGIPTARRSFLSRSERPRLLLRLWACGQRGCVVHHVHGPGAGDRLAPDRHRRAVRQRLMRTPFVIQQGLRTPTGRCAESFFIGFIPGSDATFLFTARPRGPMASSGARWTARISRGRSRFRPGCSIARHACPTCGLRPSHSLIWKRSAHCPRCSTWC